ncbi:hypothetical protein RFI_22078 [Reticulomyxa filosa]|uniref:Uncharacterized protein n=1 Tax=Reticulomyxa filosa TaxID=46433 RepID=X6MNP7_RETFI|nr:hypothetical protein RFI_22078 [Reticulomyxa filosa]|eukprot:ETO15286.1 hypothetical protein RFI_22078 [Reticulomyxa filosa]
MAWYLRKVNIPNFSNTENCEQHFAELKELVKMSFGEHLQDDKNEKAIHNEKDLKAVWRSLCCDSDTYCLKLSVVNANDAKKVSNEYGLKNVPMDEGK